MRLLAAIIIYNPDWQLLERNVEAFSQHVDHILVWNNSDKPVRLSQVRPLNRFFPKTTYKSLNKNVGIARALNYAWHYAEENGYDTLLTMDDDSVFVDFAGYKRRVEQLWSEGNECVCGPLATSKGSARGMQRVPHLITSGMLVPVKHLQLAGGYCEDFLIDGIDIELCINLRGKGISSVMDTESRLMQRYGATASRKYGPLTLHSPNYSPQRLYGIFRNHIIILRRYHYPPDLLWHIIRLYLIGFVVKGVLLVEHDKKTKLKAVAKGIRDGLRYKIR